MYKMQRFNFTQLYTVSVCRIAMVTKRYSSAVWIGSMTCFFLRKDHYITSWALHMWADGSQQKAVGGTVVHLFLWGLQYQICVEWKYGAVGFLKRLLFMSAILFDLCIDLCSLLCILSNCIHYIIAYESLDCGIVFY